MPPVLDRDQIRRQCVPIPFPCPCRRSRSQLSGDGSVQPAALPQCRQHPRASDERPARVPPAAPVLLRSPRPLTSSRLRSSAVRDSAVLIDRPIAVLPPVTL